MKKLINKFKTGNTPYGREDLKKFYNRYLTRGLVLAILLHFSAIGVYFFSIYLERLDASKDEEISVKPIVLIDIDFPPMNIKEEPEVKIEDAEIEKTKFVPLKDDAAMTPEPVRRDIAEINTTKVQDELDKINTIVSKDGDENADRNPDLAGLEIRIEKEEISKEIEKEIEKEVITNQIFETFQVEKAPSPVNLSEIKAMIRYPEIAIKSNIEGNVVAKVLVGKDGSVQRVASLSGPNIFHNEVRSKINSLKFTPALQNGQTVQCWVNVPFSFKLKD